jgi:hypothetical protein
VTGDSYEVRTSTETLKCQPVCIVLNSISIGFDFLSFRICLKYIPGHLGERFATRIWNTKIQVINLLLIIRRVFHFFIYDL